jgi:hypothetical protein
VRPAPVRLRVRHGGSRAQPTSAPRADRAPVHRRHEPVRRDDDRNGYIDDLSGWNFSRGNNDRRVNPDSKSAAMAMPVNTPTNADPWSTRTGRRYATDEPDNVSVKQDDFLDAMDAVTGVTRHMFTGPHSLGRMDTSAIAAWLDANNV